MPINLKKGGSKAVASEGGQAVSLRPSDQVSEGLLDDMDVTMSDWQFTLEGPPNYNSGDAVPLFIKVTLSPDEGDSTYQWWSAGDSAKFQPSEDGKEARRVKGSGGLGQGTNAAILFRSIADAGFPEDKMTANLGCFEGMRAHVKRIAAPKRSGLPQQEGRGLSTVLAVEKILQLPWEKKAAPKAGAAASSKKTSSPAPAATSNGDADVNDLAMAVLQTVLEKTNPIAITKIPMAAFKILSQEEYKPHRSDILLLLKDEEFLGSVATVEDGQVSA
jgi:hypothetical protein